MEVIIKSGIVSEIYIDDTLITKIPPGYNTDYWAQVLKGLIKHYEGDEIENLVKQIQSTGISLALSDFNDFLFCVCLKVGVYSHTCYQVVEVLDNGKMVKRLAVFPVLTDGHEYRISHYRNHHTKTLVALADLVDVDVVHEEFNDSFCRAILTARGVDYNEYIREWKESLES